MLRKTTTRLTPALALGLLLAAGPASAAPAPVDLFDSVRGAFAQLWLRLGGVWGEIGAEISPFGQPAPPPAGVQGDIGMQIDPFGQPSPSPAGAQGDIGMMIDPHG